jgi:hypothetical protein
MSLNQLPSVQVNQDYVKFGGGLDLVTPVLSLNPGSCLDAVNYEPDVFGGYRRIDGYERFDGRASPSAAEYHYMEYSAVNAVMPIEVGNLIIGATSGGTGIVCLVEDGALAITKLAGAFISGEGIKIGANLVGTLLTEAITRGAKDGLTEAKALSGAADIYRADVLAVPGSGALIGGFILRGTPYAMRNSADGTQAVLWRSSGAGWSQVPLGQELPFTSGGTYEVKEGDTITGNSSGATAVVTRVSLRSGSWAGGDAVGVINFLTQTGTFSAENLNVAANLNVATVAADSVAITLAPSGRLETVNWNFYASTNTLRTYGVDGVNKAFEFDGTVFSRITTGMAVDTPSHVLASNNVLYLSFNGSLQNSGIGNPHNWTVQLGASELGIGDTITNLQASPGGSVLIASRNKISLLTGKTIDTYDLSTVSDNIGALPYTMQAITPQGSSDAVLFFDDAGVAQLNRTNAYGNYLGGYISDMARPVIATLRPKVQGSVVYKARKQYRVFGNDGSGIVLCLVPTSNGIQTAITKIQYPHNVRALWYGEDASGQDVVFFGDDNGFVYQCDRGSSFDGQPIEAYLRMPFNNTKSPRLRKRYRKAIIEMAASGYSAISFWPEFNYGDIDIASHRTLFSEIQGAGNYWDAGLWNTFYYDARTVASPEFGMDGTGINVSMLFYSKSTYDLGHVLQGVIFHYSPRRLQR